MDKVSIPWDGSNTADHWSPHVAQPRHKRGSRIAATSLVLALVLAVLSAQAQTDFALEAYNAAYDAYDRGDYAAALREWRLLAEQEYPGAQYYLGRMYAMGEGVPEDDAQAVFWYRKAAEQGYAEAQYSLGLAYTYNLNVPRDYRQAMFWYRKAAEQGHAGAQYDLGVMYSLALGVPQDDAQAVAWYRKAAEQGYAEAQYDLGRRYAMGEGVPEDYVQGYAWLNLAAAQGDDKAKEARATIRKYMTREQVAEGQKLSRDLAARIASQGKTTP